MNSKLVILVNVSLIAAIASCGSSESNSTATDPVSVATDAANVAEAADPPAATTALDTVAAPGTTNGPAGVDAEGRVEFRQTVVGFVQNTVIAYGEQGLDPEIVADAIITTYPSLSVAGYAVAADETTLSFLSNSASPKDVAGTENPWIVAVAVKDTSGACLGGVAYGFPVATETLEIDEPAACTAESVATAAIAQI